MEVVRFPGLGMQFEFSKVAFTIFGISVYKYAVCIVLGIVVALLLAKLSKERFGIDFSFALESCIIAIVIGTLGARLYYVLFNLNYYANHLSEIFNFRNGGLAIYGGLILGGISILVYSRICKKDTIDLLDYLVPFVALAQFFGRFGNFFNVEAYGYETRSIFRMGIIEGIKYIEVHPMFLYEAVVNFVIFALLRILQRKRKFKGEIFLLYCMLYSFFRAILEGFRADSLMFFGLRISQVLSVIIFIVSTVLFIKNYKKTNVNTEVKVEEKNN